MEPLSTHRYLLRVTISDGLKDKLTRARELMSHANPSGDLDLVLERPLDLLLEKLAAQRFAQTKRPRPTRKIAQERLARQVESTMKQSQRQEPRRAPERKSDGSVCFDPNASNATEAMADAAHESSKAQAIWQADGAGARRKPKQRGEHHAAKPVITARVASARKATSPPPARLERDPTSGRDAR